MARALVAALAVCATSLAAQSTPKVGPPHGTVMVVGGGAQGPEVYAAFIKAAGGPNALIVDVPTAGGNATYPADLPSLRGWRTAGATNLVVLHTIDRAVANSDSFAAILKKAGGVWFEGGRHFHLVDSYAGTKTEQGFHDVLARGGVVGGSSAGATILGDFMVRGAPSNDNMIMDHPAYQKAFAFLRGVAIDQHVVARERLADLADSIMPKHPELLGMSEDEGTVWVVRGDTAEIIGRNKAFVYGGKVNDPRKPFLTLRPGDKYNLATRTVMERAAPASLEATVDQLIARNADTTRAVTILVALNGKVLVNKSYGIPDQAKYMPTTTVPQFALGAMSGIFTGLCAQGPAAAPARGNATPFQACVSGRISTPIGMHKTNATASGEVFSNVDELYRLSLGLENPRTFPRDTNAATNAPTANAGWQSQGFSRGPAGLVHFTAYSIPAGRRSAFFRSPSEHATVIVLTNDDAAKAGEIVTQIVGRILPLY